MMDRARWTRIQAFVQRGGGRAPARAAIVSREPFRFDSDPMFASLRDEPQFAETRSAAMACQQAFLAQRAQP